MDKKTRNISTSEFERVAVQNGYEFFTAEEVASYYREGIQKSMKGELSQAEKDEFVGDVRGLQKAICMDENGNAVTYYYRKSQIKWNVAADGTILKGIAGEYADTAENRKLNRVGKAFIGNVELIKSLYSDEQGIKDSTLASRALSIKKSVVNLVSAARQRGDEDFYKSIQEAVHAYMTEYGEVLDEAQGVIKAQDFQDVLEDVIDAQDDLATIVKARAGRYADTAENRRLHRVGQEYGSKKQEEAEEGKPAADEKKEGGAASRSTESVKRDISILEENKDRIVAKYGQEAYDKKMEALNAEAKTLGEEEEKRLEEKRADRQDADEEERKKAEKRAKRQERRRARHAAKREAAKKAKEEAKGDDKKKLPEGWKKSIRVIDDEDSWSVALEQAMGDKYYEVFTEDLAQDEDEWFKKMEEMIPKYMSPKQVQSLIDEVGTEAEGEATAEAEEEQKQAERGDVVKRMSDAKVSFGSIDQILREGAENKSGDSGAVRGDIEVDLSGSYNEHAWKSSGRSKPKKTYQLILHTDADAGAFNRGTLTRNQIKGVTLVESNPWEGSYVKIKDVNLDDLPVRADRR